jgi:transcriptional regulator with XRE-family HTH domain
MDSKHSGKYKTVGQTIQFYRNERGLTQEQLAEQTGISLSYLTKIEAPNSHKAFSLEVLFDIADALGVPVGKLLEGIR